MEKIELKSEIQFHVSGIQYSVNANDVSPETTLNEYLRDRLHLTATKKMCLEGGCGTCIVAVEELDSDGNKKVFAVNSCLVSIFSCHGWKILTNEGIGSRQTEYHEIQKLLAENNGSQCGLKLDKHLRGLEENEVDIAVLPRGNSTDDLGDRDSKDEDCVKTNKITTTRFLGLGTSRTFDKRYRFKKGDVEDLDNTTAAEAGLNARNDNLRTRFCSSGMVMNMYALQQSGAKTEQEIEKSFGGNLCRCTGYRPILTAFKKLASDKEAIVGLPDLEDMKPCKSLRCLKGCSKPCRKPPLYFKVSESRWVKVYSLKDLLEMIDTVGKGTYTLVAGNTARGVYWTTTTFDLYIDVTGVLELITYTTSDDSLSLGGNINLTDTTTIFRSVAKNNPKFIYLDKMADHLDLVAHVPVRNIGTLAGNLMMKYEHNEFQSDIFLILETIGATIVIVDTEENETRVTPQNFLKVDMKRKVIREIILPGYDSSYNYNSYKIMPRAQNAHAMVNAGFLLKLNTNGIVQTAQIVYGAINPTFIHASTTEKALVGKDLFTNVTLQAAFKSLDEELKPDWVLPDPSPICRKQLAINLFYKFVLSIAPQSKLSVRNKSGGTLLSRPISSGFQDLNSKKELYPLTQPINKIEALAQTSGRAKYIIDMPDQPGQLHGVLVPAQTIAGSKITSIDASKALARPGVVAFYSAQDIPGLNSIAVASDAQNVVEELFCAGTVKYYSQPIGVLVATSRQAAESAASLVTIKATGPASSPLITVQDVLAQSKTDRITHQTSYVAKKKGSDVKKVIKGQTYLGEQYHFHMENQICMVIPTEDGLNVHAGTQWMDHIQGVISQVLKIPSQKVNMFVRRLGGGFGAKLSRNGFVAGAAALAAYKTDKPVKIWMNLTDNMDMIGKRYPLLVQYEVGVNSTGAIQYLTAKLYSDFGVGGNEPIDSLIISQFLNCYKNDTWTFDTYTVRTDNYGQCFARAPGSVEGLGAIEIIMDHIAHSLDLDPLVVRKANIDDPANPILIQFLDEMKQTDNIDARKKEIKAYNEANRWKKKALSVVPMKWMLEVVANYTTLVSIFHLDGGVAVSHGGVEMGQGINTKVAQVCAYKFGIPLDKVSVKPNYNVIAPNSSSSGGSLTSEAVVYSLLKACDILLARIKPIRDKNPKASWEELIGLCFAANINLSSNGFYSNSEPDVKQYSIWACCALELEVDILTGKHEVTRVDIIEDVGQSMSPLIDLGQLEGAFVMGMGYYTSEEIIRDKNGKLLTDRTWNYKPPGARDIPANFRIKFSSNTPNPIGVLKSKAIAEPPTCLSIALPLALRMALASARTDSSPSASTWYPFNGPSTVEHTLLNTLNDYKQYTL